MLIPNPAQEEKSKDEEARKAIRFCDSACVWCLCVVLMRVLLEREREDKWGLARSSFSL